MIALGAFWEAGRVPACGQRLGSDSLHIDDNAVQWLLGTSDRARGWVPNRNGQTATYPGLTAQTLFVLACAEMDRPSIASEHVLRDLKSTLLLRRDLVRLPRRFRHRHPQQRPVFDTPGGFTSEGMQSLWYPWGVAMYLVLSEDHTLSAHEQDRAADDLKEMLSELDPVSHKLEQGRMFILAEGIIGISQVVPDPPRHEFPNGPVRTVETN